jgi:hypothetical protein
MGKNPELYDPGDLLEVPEDQREDVDPDPEQDESHAALGDGGADDVSDVDEGEYVDPATYQEGES